MAANRSGGATDLTNNDLADYADQSVAKKTDTPRSSINKEEAVRTTERERLIQNVIMCNITPL